MDAFGGHDQVRLKEYVEAFDWKGGTIGTETLLIA